MSLTNPTLPLEGEKKRKSPSHLSLPLLSPRDGTNITYGRHHAAAEPLSSPSTNNSVGLIKRNGTNYGPVPVRGPHVLRRISLASAAQSRPAQTGEGMREQAGEEGTGTGPSFLVKNQRRKEEKEKEKEAPLGVTRCQQQADDGH